MPDIPSTPPPIRFLAPSSDRPQWSVMIPVYNCARFLPETLESVLSQGIPEARMQIEVVDDASTDADVAQLVKRIGKGRVKYFRQAANVGSLRNFETCINRSTGRLIHLLHGDDRVKPGYYAKMEELFEQHPQAGAAYCRYSSINEKGQQLSIKKAEMKHDGILPNWLATIGERQLIQYVAITVRREVYERLGAFYGIEYGEDWEMWVRIARFYPVAYTPATLAEYRRHADSITGAKFLAGEHLQDLHRAMMLIQEHLPEAQRHRILRRSKKYYATYALNIARELWHKVHDKHIIDAHIRQALQFYASPYLYLLAAKLYLTIKFSKA